MIQLVFVLVRYSLQILAALVTLFLRLHVKFMRSQVTLMHDIGPRHLWEWLLSIILSLFHFYFEVTKNFRNIVEKEICSGKCTKEVLEGRKDPGS